MSVTVIEGDHRAPAGAKFVVVASRFNHFIVDRLVEGALDALRRTGGVRDADVQVAWVPGAWEIPIVVKRVLSKSDAVIGLGVVIKGETTHDQYINSVVSQSLGQMALAGDTPIAFGLLTCNTVQQAEDRCGGKVGNKGSEAAQAVVELVRLFDGRLK